MFGNDDSTEVKLRKQFWKELDDDRTVMLGLIGVQHDLTRPMTAQIDRPDGADKDDGGTIYFFASREEGIGLHKDEGQEALATFMSKGHGLFAHISGSLRPVQDRALVERLWNPIIASWYKDGMDDPNVLLLRFDAEEAVIWESSALSTLKAAGMKMLFNVDPGKEEGKDHRARVNL